VNSTQAALCLPDGGGAIKIRGGSNPTHVVIDRIGFMI